MKEAKYIKAKRGEEKDMNGECEGINESGKDETAIKESSRLTLRLNLFTEFYLIFFIFLFFGGGNPSVLAKNMISIIIMILMLRMKFKSHHVIFYILMGLILWGGFPIFYIFMEILSNRKNLVKLSTDEGHQAQ